MKVAQLEQANQAARVSDALIAEGVVIPFERLKWTDFALETRLRALRLMLAASARLRERKRIEAQTEAAQTTELKVA